MSSSCFLCCESRIWLAILRHSAACSVYSETLRIVALVRLLKPPCARSSRPYLNLKFLYGSKRCLLGVSFVPPLAAAAFLFWIGRDAGGAPPGLRAPGWA